MNLTSLQYYLDRYTLGTITKEEWKEFQRLLKDPESSAMIQEIMDKHVHETNEEEFDYPVITENVLLAVLTEINKNSFEERRVASAAPRVHLLRRRFLRYAAAVLFMVGVGTVAYFWASNKKAEQTLANGIIQLPADIPPGGDRAILTLSDGRKIILDSAANGQLANEGGVHVMKSADGKIAYDLKGLTSKEIMWNTMSTPRGGQYQVTLPDGTKVWLNASSSITYPTAFITKERKVKIDGEVYFEVAKNTRQPFVVDIHGELLVQVVGTSFNINSYKNENVIRTTLAEGSVKVIAGNKQIVLKPGYQAVAAFSGRQSGSAGGEREIRTQLVNVDQTIAWKNGFFNFEDLDTYAIIRQLERWYDIKVQYHEPIHNIIFQGQIVKDTNLSDVIELLQKGGVKCRLEGRTLIVN